MAHEIPMYDPHADPFINAMHMMSFSTQLVSSQNMEGLFDSMDREGSLTKKDVLRWSVDCSLLRSAQCKIRSDCFTFGPSKNSKFYLFVFSNSSTSFFSVGLRRIPLSNTETSSEAPITVAFSLLDVRDRCHHTCERTLGETDVVQASFDRSCYSAHQVMFITNGKLRIHCSLDVDEVLEEETSDERPAARKEAPVVVADDSLIRDLAGDFRTLLEQGIHTDVTLCVGDQTFEAHRAILAARSPVFAAMFEHDTVEKKENRIVIEDLSSDAMSQLLRFVYSGDTEDLTTPELLSLFVAADKYNLLKLKKKCSASLCAQVNSKVALNVLVTANLHADDALKEAAVQVILDNALEVIITEEWLTFLREYPDIANGIILNLAMTKSTRVVNDSSTAFHKI